MATSRTLKRHFEEVLPRIVRHASVTFRHLRCWHARQDKIQEVRSLCWRWVKRLHEAGKKWWCFVSRLADYACRAVKSGRKLAGSIKASDVLNEVTQAREGFCVGKLPAVSTESTNLLVEALADNTRSEVPDQAAFRCDFPRWRATYDRRQQRIIDDLALGHRTKDVARKFKISEGRVSQLRRQFQQDWNRFTGDEPVCHPRPRWWRKKRGRA